MEVNVLLQDSVAMLVNEFCNANRLRSKDYGVPQ